MYDDSVKGVLLFVLFIIPNNTSLEPEDQYTCFQTTDPQDTVRIGMAYGMIFFFFLFQLSSVLFSHQNFLFPPIHTSQSSRINHTNLLLNPE